MRKFNYYLISFVALVAVVISCQKDKLEVLDSPETDGTTEIGGYPVTISASTPASDTKVAIDGLNVSWETGDQLRVGKYVSTAISVNNYKSHGQMVFEMEGEPIGNKADFSGSFGDNDHIKAEEYLYAISPSLVTDGFTLNSSPTRRISYTFKPAMIQEHKYKDASLALDSSSISPYVLMYGKSTTKHTGMSMDTATIAIKMNHLMTYIDFTLSNLSGKTVDSLVISTPSLIASQVTYYCYEDSTSFDYKTVVNDIRLRLSQSDGTKGVSPSGDLTVRVAACIAAPTTGTSWTISAFNGDTPVGVGSSKAATKEFKRGSLYQADISIVISEVTDPNDQDLKPGGEL